LAEGRSTDRLTVVMGSSAADLDSIVGSLCYAYLLDEEKDSNRGVLPFVPISREDFQLRSEVVYLFELERVSVLAVPFADELDLEDLLQCRDGELVVVDDRGAELPAALRGRISEVIDHHMGDAEPAEANLPRQLRRRIVEPVGSACTLVAQQVLERRPEILDRQMAILLLAAVLLDTADLDPKAGRATARDREIARLLKRTVSANTAELYDRLARARFDIADQSSIQLLERDYKEGRAGRVRFGMSSVPLLLDAWRKRDEQLQEALSGFLAQRGLDLLVVLLYGEDEGFRRQLVLCTGNEQLLDQVVSHLAKYLDLAGIPLVNGGGDGAAGRSADKNLGTSIRGFTQADIYVSRKIIAPRLRKILQSL
jgi:exopolyphosphatase